MSVVIQAQGGGEEEVSWKQRMPVTLGRREGGGFNQRQMTVGHRKMTPSPPAGPGPPWCASSVHLLPYPPPPS